MLNDSISDTIANTYTDSLMLFSNDSVSIVEDTIPVQTVSDSIISMFPSTSTELDYEQSEPRSELFETSGFLFLLSLTLIAFARFLAPKKFLNLIGSVSPFRSRNYNPTEYDSLTGPPFISIIIFSIISLTLALVQINTRYELVNFNTTGILIYESFFIVIILVYLLYKIIFVLLSSFMFKHNKSAELYFRGTFNHILVMSVVLFPFTVFYHYTSYSVFLIVIVLVFLVFFLLNFLDSYFIGIRISKVSQFYIILYLCMLEIAPLLWLYILV